MDILHTKKTTRLVAFPKKAQYVTVPETRVKTVKGVKHCTLLYSRDGKQRLKPQKRVLSFLFGASGIGNLLYR